MQKVAKPAQATKLAPDYVARTLARLLPPPEVIAKLSGKALLDLHTARNNLEAAIRNDPVRFFIPNVGGQRDFMEYDGPASVLLNMAGNKAGKSTGGAIRLLERLIGSPLWGRDHRVLNYKTPVRVAIFADDFEAHRDTTLPTLETWAPRGFIKHKQRNSAGHITEIVCSNGSSAVFKTYDQGSDKAEGKDWVEAWCDEPPPRDVYTAIRRGLIVHGGRLMITATLLKEPWLFDEQDYEWVKIFEADIHSNDWVNTKAKLEYLASLTDEERAVRETGRPMSLVGRVYKSFLDGSPYVVPDHPIPQQAVVFSGVDPHERRPTYNLYGYVDALDRIVWIGYVFAGGSETDIQDTLRAWEQDHLRDTLGHFRPPAITIMDPNRGKALQLGGRSWEDVYTAMGYSVFLADDDIKLGHTEVLNYLDPKGPRMHFMEACRGKGGPIYQMQRYSWDAWKFGKSKSDPKEKVSDTFKDFPDIIRYTARTGLEYDQLAHGFQVLDRFDAADVERGRERVHGYIS